MQQRWRSLCNLAIPSQPFGSHADLAILQWPIDHAGTAGGRCPEKLPYSAASSKEKCIFTRRPPDESLWWRRKRPAADAAEPAGKVKPRGFLQHVALHKCSLGTQNATHPRADTGGSEKNAAGNSKSERAQPNSI